MHPNKLALEYQLMEPRPARGGADQRDRRIKSRHMWAHHFVEEEYIYMPVPSKARLGNSARIILLGISCDPFHRWIISVVDLV
jgi:hypothetical protein